MPIIFLIFGTFFDEMMRRVFFTNFSSHFIDILFAFAWTVAEFGFDFELSFHFDFFVVV